MDNNEVNNNKAGENEMNFEDALARLEEIVKQLEDGRVSLEKALELFNEGIRLSKICSSRLDAVEKNIKLLLSDEEGNLNIEEAGENFGGGS